MGEEKGISPSFEDETLEAKARWFQSLPLSERLDIFCEMTELLLEINPRIVDAKDAQPVPGRIRVLELPRS